ncbi:MAG: very short patch repair endonuclease [Turicibacter sp.]|nr:very short patch repair endonuclease [Turicibacter sp.]
MEFNTSAERSKLMSRIRSAGGKGETMLQKSLWHKNIRYRKNYRKIPGSPDIALTKYKIAVFIDGEFWHGFDWKARKERGFKNNPDYWIKKIERNIQRDIEVNQQLQELDWLVLRFWEKAVLKNLDDCIRKIEAAILYRVYEKELRKKTSPELEEDEVAMIDAMFYLAGD